jgi:hypothetical protein
VVERGEVDAPHLIRDHRPPPRTGPTLLFRACPGHNAERVAKALDGLPRGSYGLVESQVCPRHEAGGGIREPDGSNLPDR